MWLRFIVGLVCIGCYSASALAGKLEHTRNRMIRVENSLIIVWEPFSSDFNENQINVSDQAGGSITAINVLRPIHDAERVGIYDVSARRGAFIAVAAVFSKAGARSLRPVPTLLLFDFSGRLLSVFALDPAREISRLVVDEELNVWTLTAHSNNRLPTSVPFVVEYSRTGEVLKQSLTRSMFPFHAAITKADSSTGTASIGYDAGHVWFWLPGSAELVSVSVTDGQFTIAKTDVPRRSGHNAAVPFRVAREPDGKIVGQFHEVGEHGGSEEIANYVWSPQAGSWSRSFPGDCDGGRFMGIGDNGQMYLMYNSDSPDSASICTFRPD